MSYDLIVRPSPIRVALMASALVACNVREQPLPDSGAEKPGEFRGIAIVATPGPSATSGAAVLDGGARLIPRRTREAGANVIDDGF